MFSGKKTSIVENPVVPAEPIEPVIRGSMAVGCVSLAVAKAAAAVRDMPLYLHVALLKHNQVLEMLPVFQLRYFRKTLTQTAHCTCYLRSGRIFYFSSVGFGYFSKHITMP